MKYIFVIFVFIFPLLVGTAYTNETLVPEISSTKNNHGENDDAMSTKIRIKIGNKTFLATLSDNTTATAFKDLLPLTMLMTELNDNEKYSDLPGSLPTQASRPSSIQTGDLMLYGSRTLVLSPQSGFKTNYENYNEKLMLVLIKLAGSLSAALGSGNVTVTFEMLKVSQVPALRKKLCEI